jgi:L-fuconolactonase
MSPLLDAHAHFFDPGFIGSLPENCRRSAPDEITLYTALANQHEIAQVLAVGYEGDAWASGNNAYLAALTSRQPWARPVAFVADLMTLSVDQLEQWQQQGFVGLSLYLFKEKASSSLHRVLDEIWRWLSDHAWLISVNSTGAHWKNWQAVLERFPEVRLLIAHLGLPPAVTTEITVNDAQVNLAHVTTLAKYAHTYVKFSGFYALAQPSHAYPHEQAWPYAQVITEAFGTARILWASDFSPALEHVSFPQTIATLAAMPWLSAMDQAAIYHDNLARLLHTVEERKGTR